jgi:hypothetical protein
MICLELEDEALARLVASEAGVGRKGVHRIRSGGRVDDVMRRTSLDSGWRKENKTRLGDGARQARAGGRWGHRLNTSLLHDPISLCPANKYDSHMSTISITCLIYTYSNSIRREAEFRGQAMESLLVGMRYPGLLFEVIS